jgi:hypothetical protein
MSSPGILAGQPADLQRDDVVRLLRDLEHRHGRRPRGGSPLYANPDLKRLLGLVVGGGRYDSITVSKATLTSNGVPFVDDTIDGGHEWYTWRLLLHDFGASVVFRQTSTAVSVNGTTATATVTPGTAEPVAPSGSVQFSAGGAPLGAPVALVGGKAVLNVPDTGGAASVSATYSGDSYYNASSGNAALESGSGSTGVSGVVPSTLSIVLGPAASFGAFTPGFAHDYMAPRAPRSRPAPPTRRSRSPARTT